MATMPLAAVPIASFARFYDATGPQKVRIVRDSRLYQSDPKSYRTRDFYLEFRNVLRQTHWATNDISKFAAALDSLVSRQKPAKRGHYRTLGDAYINFWTKEDRGYFRIESESVPLADLEIRVGVEVGMRYGGDDLALKLSLTAPRRTRAYRQVIQHLTGQALAQSPRLQPAIWDVRREEILPPATIPKDFQIALEGQAMAFKQIWESLGSEE